MKKYIPYANLLALGAGAFGMLLQFLLYWGGTDEKGLYPAAHPAWVLLCVLFPAVVIFLWLLTRKVGISRNYRGNFPASLSAAAGYLVAAAGLLFAGIRNLDNDKLIYLISGSLGILGSILLLWAAWCRYRGQKCTGMPHALPCFFFALQLFVIGQSLGAEPELCRYLFRFLAILSMLPACYLLWGFDVGMGKRQNCMFWCLTSGYLNLVAIAGNPQWLLHLCMAAWMLSALPRLQYLPKKPRPAPVEECQAQTIEPIAPQEVDALLDQILSDLDTKP
ncbi:MAG: hypothetical protein IKY59_06615 [Oscillospiraceae bacterium]|nr:hypothetical protein [Oscillospiraceae bacterium]